MENLEIIKDALESGLYLLNDEFQSVDHDLLKENYLDVIQKLENALAVLEKNG